MNDKWTTVSKVVVKVSLGLCALGVVFMFINGLVTGNGGVWITALISIIPVLISHIAWAMYIEMSENSFKKHPRNRPYPFRYIADVRQDTCEYVKRGSCQTRYSLEMLLRKGKSSRRKFLSELRSCKKR